MNGMDIKLGNSSAGEAYSGKMAGEARQCWSFYLKFLAGYCHA
jgi:hypothetical protein